MVIRGLGEVFGDSVGEVLYFDCGGGCLDLFEFIELNSYIV